MKLWEQIFPRILSKFYSGSFFNYFGISSMKDAYSVNTKKKILLIEDNNDTQLMYKIFLRDKFELEVCGDGEKGMCLLNKNQYDLLILDINLPGKMDGSKVLDKIRNSSEMNDIPVLVVTAYTMKEDKDKFLTQGASDYLSKPVKKEDLISKINKITVACI